MYEMLGKLKPMEVIHLPNVPDRERSLDAWVAEIRKFQGKPGKAFRGYNHR